MKDLPRVFPGKVLDNLQNTQDIFYGSDRVVSADKGSIIKKINDIFASKDHVYKSKVEVKLKNGTGIETIVGKTSTDLITIEGKKIKIIDIEDIKKI